MFNNARRSLVGLAAGAVAIGGGVVSAAAPSTTAAAATTATGAPSRTDPPAGAVAMVGTGKGYLVTTRRGNVYNFHTHFDGSMAGKPLPAPVVGIAADPHTSGYWIVTNRGNVYSFGAPWYGSMAGKPLPAPVTGITATKTGYVLATSRGNVYSFHTDFDGSRAGKPLPAPVAGVAADPSTTGGYWLLTRAGNVYGYGAPWYGRPLVVSSSPHDTPAGFWYGTDSYTSTPGGSGPYTEPKIGGAYGGYVGMLGDWAYWQGCGRYSLEWSNTDSHDANVNYSTYHEGIGTAAYWFMGGPGVDPHYNATTSEAYSWGERQAARVLADVKTKPVKYPVLVMDVELPGSTLFDPVTDNGWNHVYTSACSGRVKSTYVAPAVDRADVNGFAAWIVKHSHYKVGVYSSPAMWSQIFGTGAASRLTNTYEWTASRDTSSLSHPPSNWCLRGTSTCAQFFGGITSSSRYALMWQWSGGGGTSNGVADFDQIDANRVG